MNDLGIWVSLCCIMSKESYCSFETISSPFPTRLETKYHQCNVQRRTHMCICALKWVEKKPSLEIWFHRIHLSLTSSCSTKTDTNTGNVDKSCTSAFGPESSFKPGKLLVFLTRKVHIRPICNIPSGRGFLHWMCAWSSGNFRNKKQQMVKRKLLIMDSFV